MRLDSIDKHLRQQYRKISTAVRHFFSHQSNETGGYAGYKGNITHNKLFPRAGNLFDDTDSEDTRWYKLAVRQLEKKNRRLGQFGSNNKEIDDGD
jgi:hypothetical protein